MTSADLRVPYRSWAPGFKPMWELHRAVQNGPLPLELVELVRMRASQINGCGYCLDVHSKDAMSAGETAQRLLVLPAWREAPFFDARERAALALTEAVTQLGPHGVPSEVLDSCETNFSSEEVTALLYAIVEINAWNRLAMTGGAPVGSYTPRSRTGQHANGASQAAPQLRIARPSDDPEQTATFYIEVLDLQPLARFVDHEGFDGVIVGRPEWTWHLELVHERGHVHGRAPDPEHQIVVYEPDPSRWHQWVERVEALGHPRVAANNPYWDRYGATFQDPDGYPVVIANRHWENA